MPVNAPATSAPPASWLRSVLDALQIGPGEVEAVRSNVNHSNDIHEITCRSGRVLLVKVARHGWGAHFFGNAAAAAARITAESDVLVPHPLPLRLRADGRPVQAYWRIDLPTLAELWPALRREAREEALRTLGELLRRLHRIRPPAWGPLRDGGAPTQAAALEHELQSRLLPATIAHWPEGIPMLEQLIDGIPLLAPTGGPALVHGDLHLGNVLCHAQSDGVRCVGLLDLDEVAGGTPESDVASLDVLHGPVFERKVERPLLAAVREGYGEPLDERAIHYFNCVHLANQGFSSAFLGHHEHAAIIRAELAAQLEALHAVTAAQ